MTEPDDLTHWGVKGMRWGVRRSETPSNESPSLGHIRASHVIMAGASIALSVAQANAKTILKKSPKAIAKGAVFTTKAGISAAKNTQRIAAGSKVAFRIVGATGRGAKAYVRGTAKVVRALR